MEKPYLTSIEEEVASLYCGEKLSYEQIGELLSMSPRTAANHMRSVGKRFGGYTPTTVCNIWSHLD